MTTPPTSGQTSASPSPLQSPAGRLFGACWGCRILSGSGLLLSAGYVFLGARRMMLRGGPTSFGNVVQIAFALGLAAWGIVVIVDPVDKAHRKV